MCNPEAPAPACRGLGLRKCRKTLYLCPHPLHELPPRPFVMLCMGRPTPPLTAPRGLGSNCPPSPGETVKGRGRTVDSTDIQPGTPPEDASGNVSPGYRVEGQSRTDRARTRQRAEQRAPGVAQQQQHGWPNPTAKLS